MKNPFFWKSKFKFKFWISPFNISWNVFLYILLSQSMLLLTFFTPEFAGLLYLYCVRISITGSNHFVFFLTWDTVIRKFLSFFHTSNLSLRVFVASLLFVIFKHDFCWFKQSDSILELQIQIYFSIRFTLLNRNLNRLFLSINLISLLIKKNINPCKKHIIFFFL